MAPQPTQEGEVIAPDPPPPDGSRDAWLVVLGAMVFAVHTWGIVNSFGVFQTYYERELFMAADHHQGVFLVHYLVDRDHLRLLFVAGHGLVFLGMFATSFCTKHYELLLAQGICVGLGCGLLYLPCAAAVGQWFEKRQALAMGMQSVGSPIAGIILPIIFRNLQPRLGFGWATRVIALILLGLSAVPHVFVKAGTGGPGGIRDKQRRAFFDTTFLGDVSMLVFTAAISCVFLRLWAPFFYAQLYSIRFEVSSVQFSPYFVTLLNVGSALSRIIPPWVAVYTGAPNTMLCMTTLCKVLGFMWMGISNFPGLVVFAVLYGLFQGGLVRMLPSSIMALTPDMRRLGTRMGTSYMFLGLSVLARTPIAGAILGRGGDLAWKGLIAYSGATLAGGSVLLILALVLHRRERHE
ncbi:major facilitator superfamily transporter [Apiospora arundinis]|uniref:Major facilitator superfamily transporter n=1 Tax=Apiospora arundinis TaxID=335852 RepID=A0ABR2HSF1_9PEZI